MSLHGAMGAWISGVVLNPLRAGMIAQLEFLHRGRGVSAIWGKLKGQVFLGSPTFIEKMQSLVKQQPSLNEIPRAQRRAIVSDIAEFERIHNRKDAIPLAYLSGQYTMSSIAAHFGVHYTTVSRLVEIQLI